MDTDAFCLFTFVDNSLVFSSPLSSSSSSSSSSSDSESSESDSLSELSDLTITFFFLDDCFCDLSDSDE